MEGNTSMEIGVRVESENLITGAVFHTVSAYLTFVALDREGRPTPVPPLILETDAEQRRNREAKARREFRLPPAPRLPGGIMRKRDGNETGNETRRDPGINSITY